MDVVTPEEARIAEEAGAVAVMALERVPADIRRNGGVARMSDPQVLAGGAVALLPGLWRWRLDGTRCMRAPTRLWHVCPGGCRSTAGPSRSGCCLRPAPLCSTHR